MPSILDEDSWALVLFKDGHLELHMPDKIDPDRKMTKMELFLGMIFVKSRDEEFIQEIISEYDGPVT